MYWLKRKYRQIKMWKICRKMEKDEIVSLYDFIRIMRLMRLLDNGYVSHHTDQSILQISFNGMKISLEMFTKVRFRKQHLEFKLGSFRFDFEKESDNINTLEFFNKQLKNRLHYLSNQLKKAIFELRKI